MFSSDVWAMTAVVAAYMMVWPIGGFSQGANSPEAQRLAAQKNRAVLQQMQARRQALAAQQYRQAQSRVNRQSATGMAGTSGMMARQGAYSSGTGGVAGARPTASAASMRGLSTALQAFSADVGRMPTQAEGLQVLLQAPPGVRGWRGPYISQVNWHQALSDPWGNPYRYTVSGNGRYSTYTISSDGPDRIPGTADDLRINF